MESNNNIPTKQLKEDESCNIKSDFRLFEIPDEQIPEYTTAQEFSKKFKRCSVLRMDEVRYASTSDAMMCLR